MRKIFLSTLFVLVTAFAFAQDSVNITFHVNMNNETVAATGVYLAGGAGFGVPGDNQMTDPDGDGVYSITMRRPENWSSDYTFLNGNCSDWSCKENIAGQPCAVAPWNDRTLSVGVNDTSLWTCFAICSNDTSCTAPPPPDSVNVTFQVNMRQQTVDPTGVFLAGGGTFGNPGDNPMSDSDGDGVYDITVRLPENSFSYYIFTNGNAGWGNKENLAGLPCGDPANFNDRSYTLGVNDTTISTCYEVCSNDTSCMPPMGPDSVNITFHVNMNQQMVDPGGVYVAGGSGFGLPGDNQMMDPDGDGVYSITLRRPENWSSHYAFLNGNCPAWNCKEDLAGQPCADPNNFNDRFLSTSTNDTTIWTCFAVCSDDTSCTPPMAPDSVNVTFEVNMRQQTVDPTGVFLAGGGTFGNPGDNPMSDPDGDGVYTITTRHPANFFSYYIFTNGNAGWGNKEDIAGLPCADPGNFNDRSFTLGTNDTTISTCYEQCSNDTSCMALLPPVNITFRVDMKEQTVDPSGVFMGANFDNWSGGIQMDDSDGDMIYEYTTALDQNALIEWKFINGANWAGPENFDPASSDSTCTLTTGPNTNRVYTTGSADATLDAFCFDSCGVCRTVGIDAQVFDKNLFKVQPNRVKDMTTLVFSSIATEVREVTVFDATGRQVLATTIAGSETRHALNVANFSNGMYFITVRQDTKIGTQKMIVVD